MAYSFERAYRGIKCALGLFQLAMDVSITSVTWQFALIHLNHIGICSRTPDKHTDHGQQLSTLRNDVHVELNLINCEFFTKGINYIGLVILQGCLRLSTCTIDARSWLEHSSRLTPFWGFLGLGKVLCQLDPKCSRGATCWARTSEKVRCRPFKDYPLTR